MKYIVYDLEATCWEGNTTGRQQETIEIGAVKLNRYGEVLDSFSRFVKPEIHPFLSPFCLHLTQIDQADINRASKFPSVIEDYMDWIGLEEEYILASWGNFDRIQLERDCKLHRLEDDWLINHINLKKQYARLKRINNPIGLKKAVKKEGFEFTGMHHRAIADAENLTKIFGKYLEDWQVE